MSWLGDLYNTIVTQPLINLLQILQNIVGDIGIAIMLSAAIINFILWPLFNKNYINTQKLKYLSPQLEKIQENFKNNPQELLMKRAELLKKHGVSTGSFWVILLQLPFVFSLYAIINNISAGKEITGVYHFIKPDGIATFGHQAFGMWDLKTITHTLGTPGYLLALAVSISSLMLGLYMFRIAPKPKLPEPPKAKPLFQSKDPNAPDFSQTLQKSIEIQSIYVFPLLYFITNINFAVGLVLYFLASSLSGLIRQIGITQYYAKHGDRLLESIIASDPSLENPATESPDIKAEPVDLATNPTSTEVIDVTTTVPANKAERLKTIKKTTKQKARAAKLKRKRR